MHSTYGNLFAAAPFQREAGVKPQPPPQTSPGTDARMHTFWPQHFTSSQPKQDIVIDIGLDLTTRKLNSAATAKHHRVLYAVLYSDEPDTPSAPDPHSRISSRTSCTRASLASLPFTSNAACASARLRSCRGVVHRGGGGVVGMGCRGQAAVTSHQTRRAINAAHPATQPPKRQSLTCSFSICSSIVPRAT